MNIKFDQRQKMGGLALLAQTEDATVDAAFFDPQYRSVLDRQRYGNESARQQRRAKLQVMDAPTIIAFVDEIARVLKPSRHLFLWADKFVVAEWEWKAWTRPVGTGLRCVDLIHWDKIRLGMGRRARCRSEYLIVLQKEPIRAKGIWKDRALPDTWAEASMRERHPHAKPFGLIYRLIKATTKRGDVVLDPAAGSYAVLDACRKTGRRFLGCDVAEFPDA